MLVFILCLSAEYRVIDQSISEVYWCNTLLKVFTFVMLFYLFLIKFSKVCTYFRFVPWDCSWPESDSYRRTASEGSLFAPEGFLAFRMFSIWSLRFSCVLNVLYLVLKVSFRSECSVFGLEGFLAFRMFCVWS